MPGVRKRHSQVAEILEKYGNEIIHDYIAGKSAMSIGRPLGLRQHTIISYLTKVGCPTRSLAEQRALSRIQKEEL